MSKTMVLKTLMSLKLRFTSAGATETSVFSSVVPKHVDSVDLNVFLLCWRSKSFISFGLSVSSVFLTAILSVSKDLITSPSEGEVGESVLFPTS